MADTPESKLFTVTLEDMEASIDAAEIIKKFNDTAEQKVGVYPFTLAKVSSDDIAEALPKAIDALPGGMVMGLNKLTHDYAAAYNALPRTKDYIDRSKAERDGTWGMYQEANEHLKNQEGVFKSNLKEAFGDIGDELKAGALDQRYMVDVIADHLLQKNFEAHLAAVKQEQVSASDAEVEHEQAGHNAASPVVDGAREIARHASSRDNELGA